MQVSVAHHPPNTAVLVLHGSLDIDTAPALKANLGRLVELIVKEASCALNQDAIYETDMAEGLKAMALEGHGLAFLPSSSVKKELASGRLVPAAAPGEFGATMELRIYRERPEVSRRHKPAAQALWDYLNSAA